VKPLQAQPNIFQAAVVGAGPAGLLAAVALAQGGVQTALIAPRQPYRDNRTTALLAGSVNALRALDVWRFCNASATPIAVMRLIDDRGGLLRAPEVRFDASEIGLDVFGYNVENRVLTEALESRAAELPRLTRIAAAAVELVPGAETCIDHADDGDAIAASLVIGADGRESLCRRAAGIAVQVAAYDQTAIALMLRHSRPHQNISTEFHTASGPFTLVPLGGMRSSLVWVMRREDADRIASLSPLELNCELERRSHSILGKIEAEPGHSVFPLSLQSADTLARNRIALIGEAAHLLPPIGAQGLNLGFRDAAVIAECAVDAVNAGDDPGGDAVLARYATLRQFDVSTRSIAVDMLNRSLLTDFIPVQGARGLAMYLANSIGPLRRTLMREGLAPRANEPRLMQAAVTD
jgi:2-octaprenyl-6-methoxyphenol hydroxylase